MIPVMHLSLALYLSWLGILGLGLCNAVLVVWRKLYQRLPWLLAYLAVSSGYGAILWLLQPRVSQRTYQEAYWIHQLALLVITMLLVYSFWKVGLAKYRGLHLLCAGVLLSTFVVELLVVLFTSRSGPSIALTSANWMNQWLFLFYRSGMFVAAGLLCAFFGLVHFFQIPVTRATRGLALGLSLFALAHVVLDSWTYLMGMPSLLILNSLHFASALLLHTLWFVTIVRYRANEPLETTPTLDVRASPEDLDRQMEAINLALLRLTGSRGPK